MRCGLVAVAGAGAPAWAQTAGAAIVLAPNAVNDLRNERRELQPHIKSRQAPADSSALRSTGSHFILVPPLQFFMKRQQASDRYCGQGADCLSRSATRGAK